MFNSTVKPALSGHSKRRSKLVFKTDYRLMQVRSIAECSNGSILQYFRPSLSYHLSLRSLFCLFLSGRLRQVLLCLPIHSSPSLAKRKPSKQVHWYDPSVLVHRPFLQIPDMSAHSSISINRKTCWFHNV